MTKLVQQEQDKWITKYDEAMEQFKSQSAASELVTPDFLDDKLTSSRW